MMASRFSTLLSSLLYLVSVTSSVTTAYGAAIPSSLSKRGSSDHSDITDIDILNFALTLEHVENVFYTTGLQNFSASAFASAGFAPQVRGFYEQVSEHEQTHVDDITSTIEALGGSAVAACQYDYGVTDVKGFVQLSDMFEAIGSSAYSGSAKYLHNSELLVTAATILATEARQSTWINYAVLESNAWSTAYETPLDLNQIFTLASGIITSCPSTNPSIPVTPFPPLTTTVTQNVTVNGTTSATPIPGDEINLSFTLSEGSCEAGLYAVFLSGQDEYFIPLNSTSSSSSYQVTIPTELRGFTFLVITNSSTAADDTVTVAGPAMYNFAFDSQNDIVVQSS